MIIHAYLTDGFYPWGEFFLESLRYFHKNIPVILSTRNLNNEQITNLESYGSVNVENEDLSYKKLAKRANITLDELHKHKNQIENVHITQESKVWKLMIAADDRVKSVYETLKGLDGKSEHMFHIDIDMYFRARLDDMFNIIRANDISTRFRLKSKHLNRKILISVLGFKINDKSFKFMEEWINFIDNVKPYNRPIGYGQTSCYYAYQKLINTNTRWGNIPQIYASPMMRTTDKIWAANTTKGKTENLKIFREDFEKIST